MSFLNPSKIKWDQITLCSFFFFWVNKTLCSSHPRIFRFTSPSTIIKTQNPSSPSIYSSPLLQLMLWNFKRISRCQWCMYFCILYRQRFSIYPDCTFLHKFKGLALQNERFDYSYSFVFVNKQMKTPKKRKKEKTKYQRDVHKFKGKKSYSQIEKKIYEKGRKYTWVLRLRSWSVSIRSLNPWWTVRRSRECGDEAEPPSSLPSQKKLQA